MTKAAISIETVAILVVAVVVLIVLVLFFMGYIGRGKLTMSAVEAYTKFTEECNRLVDRGCADLSKPSHTDYCKCWQCECNDCTSSEKVKVGTEMKDVTVCSDDWIRSKCGCY